MCQVFQNVTTKSKFQNIQKKFISWFALVDIQYCWFLAQIYFLKKYNLIIRPIWIFQQPKKKMLISSNFWTDSFNQFCQSCSSVPTHYSHDSLFTLKRVYVLHLHIKVIHGVFIKMDVFVLRCQNYVLKRSFE
jgi:hypothetical protein